MIISIYYRKVGDTEQLFRTFSQFTDVTIHNIELRIWMRLSQDLISRIFNFTYFKIQKG